MLAHRMLFCQYHFTLCVWVFRMIQRHFSVQKVLRRAPHALHHRFRGVAMHSLAMVSSAMAVSPSDLPAGGLGDLGVGLSLGFQRMMSTSVSWLHQLFDLKTSIKREHWVRTVHSRLVYHVCLCNPLHSSCALKQYSTGIT